jgi:hypothetical protein
MEFSQQYGFVRTIDGLFLWQQGGLQLEKPQDDKIRAYVNAAVTRYLSEWRQYGGP